MSKVVDLYTIQILVDHVDSRYRNLKPDDTAEIMAETEENLTDLLPTGYRARIRRWDDNTDERTNPDA